MDTTCQHIDATALLRDLSIETIETRLSELTAEEKALRTLLRSVKARERAKWQMTAGRRQEATR